MCVEGHAEGIEAGRPLVGDRMHREGGTYLEVVGQWRVAAAGTDDDVFYAVGSEERSKYVDVFVIRICFHS